ncbi:ribonuclease J [Candidatus Woesearchaeota archaeon]|nr:MAG: ribonuclease J [Candidatus Woesearchaeota archaeon]
MVVSFRAVGGFGEIGRNMSAVRVRNNVFIFDMGLHMPNYISLTEQEGEELVVMSESRLKKADAIPQDKLIDDWKADVKAILLTHAHLDHMGAVPWLAHKYDCPVICTPFTAHVLRSVIRDESIEFFNEIIELLPGESFRLSDGFSVEFVRTTHSTVQTIIVALHTPEGVIMYGNDYRLDKNPTLGLPPDFDRFKELGQKGVKLLIQDCLYSCREGHNGSETEVKKKLREVLLDEKNVGKGVIVTTFSSHIERLNNIAEIGKLMNRKVYFLGRSIAKYVFAAQDCGIAKFEGVVVSKFAKQSRKYLKEILKKGKENALLVVTGNQGEPKATLSKMVDGVLPFDFSPGDVVVFSSSIIPADINRENRAVLDSKLKDVGVDIVPDVHISGHSFRADIADFLRMINAEHVIPAHGDSEKTDCMVPLLKEIGYADDKIHVVVDGKTVDIE